MKNQTSKIAFCGMIVALGTMLIMLTILPNFTLALPALAGALLVAVVIEVNIKYALISYGAVSLLSIFIAPDKISAFAFIIFFGYYPIIKPLFERLNGRLIVWICKLLFFNIIIISAYFLGLMLFKIARVPFEILVLLASNIVFFIYDLAINNVVGFYLKRIHRNVSKFLK